MEASTHILISLAAFLAGAAAAWFLARAASARFQAERDAATEAVERLTRELSAARAEAEAWRKRHQEEEVARAREAAAAARVPSLEAELREARESARTASTERATFQEQAERVPGLEAELKAARADVVRLTGQLSSFQEQAERVTALDSELKASQADVVRLTGELAALETRVREQERAHAEKVAALTQVRSEIEKDLKNIAAEALRHNQEGFLNLANEVFAKHKESAAADLDVRTKAIENLLNPVRETLAAYQFNLTEIEKARVQAQGALSAELKSVIETQMAVRTETSKLVNALRAAPKTRGRWGENTLRNVLELAGLSAHCDFTTEETFERDGAALRPDVIVRLSGGRNLVIDAKTSISAYLDAFEATDDETREKYLRLHATQLRNHVKQLGDKAYWDRLVDAPDFVVMFVPGENFYAAAVERDPGLFDYALSQRVLIATPATLIALAKAVAFGWRQEKVAENARRVHELGRELYNRLAKMGEHVAGVGKGIETAVKKYNDLVGGLENRVMPQARRFTELEVEGTADEIQPLAAIEIMPREVQPGRDLLLPPAASAAAVPAAE